MQGEGSGPGDIGSCGLRRSRTRGEDSGPGDMGSCGLRRSRMQGEGSGPGDIGSCGLRRSRMQGVGGSGRGFTLIELLVVIAIIAILAAILLPVFAAAREHARRNACSSSLAKIGQALELYNKDQGGFPPGLWDRNPNGNVYNTAPEQAWTAGLLLLLGKDSPRVALGPDPNAADPYNQVNYLSNQSAYLTLQDLRCPDDPVTDPTDISYAITSGPNSFAGPWTAHQGYDSYDGPDLYAAAQASWNYAGSGPDNPVSTMKYSLCRLPGDPGCVSPYPDDFGITTPPPYKDVYANPDYTRQLRFVHPDSDTVVTWCTEHRPFVNGIPTPDNGKNDLVLFLDGKVLPKVFVPFSTSGTADHPVTGNGLIDENK